ncbi:MAG: hypothetical protein ACFE91_08570 [Promethearchaeota archaeon]
MLRFNIAIFNPAKQNIYIDQLKVLLQSIWDLYQDTVEIAIYYTQVDQKEIEEIKNKFPKILIKEREIKYKYRKQNVPLPAQRNNLWYYLLEDCNKQYQVFIDADMLLLRKIDHFFDDSFDIGYTFKTDVDEVLNKPINCGIILVNNTLKAREFMKYWTDETNKKLDSDDPFGSGWGSADQKTLGETLGTRKKKKYQKIITRNGVRFKGFPCKILNNILSPSLDDPSVHIVHFKGSWRNILIEGKWEKSLRTRMENDLDLYNLWKKTLEKYNSH